MNGWQRRPIMDPEHRQQLPPALLEKLMADHLKELDALQDEIAEHIQASRAMSGKKA